MQHRLLGTASLLVIYCIQFMHFSLARASYSMQLYRNLDTELLLPLYARDERKKDETR